MAALASMAAMKRSKQLEESGQAEDESEGVSGAKGTYIPLFHFPFIPCYRFIYSFRLLI